MGVELRFFGHFTGGDERIDRLIQNFFRIIPKKFFKGRVTGLGFSIVIEHNYGSRVVYHQRFEILFLTDGFIFGLPATGDIVQDIQSAGRIFPHQDRIDRDVKMPIKTGKLNILTAEELHMSGDVMVREKYARQGQPEQISIGFVQTVYGSTVTAHNLILVIGQKDQVRDGIEGTLPFFLSQANQGFDPQAFVKIFLELLVSLAQISSAFFNFELKADFGLDKPDFPPSDQAKAQPENQGSRIDDPKQRLGVLR